MPPTACTARRATSRTRCRTSAGSFPRAAAGPITRTCEARGCRMKSRIQRSAAMKTVSDLLKARTRDLICIRPEQSVLEAIKVLAEEDIGAALVMSGDQIASIFSERDYKRKAILKGRSSDTTRGEEVRTARRVCVS